MATGNPSQAIAAMTTEQTIPTLDFTSSLVRRVDSALRSDHGKEVSDAISTAVLQLAPSIWDKLYVPGVTAFAKTVQITVTGCKSGSEPPEFSLAIAPTVRVPFNFGSRTLHSYGRTNDSHGPMHPTQIGVKVTREDETFTARLDQGAILSVQLHSSLEQELVTERADYRDRKRVIRAVMAMADDIGTGIRELNPDHYIDDFSRTRFSIIASRFPDGDDDVSYSVKIEPRIVDFFAGEVHRLSPISRQVSTPRLTGGVQPESSEEIHSESSEESSSSSSEDEAA